MTSEEMQARKLGVARAYLVTEGFEVLDQEWHGTEGALDLVAAERNELVVFQVTMHPNWKDPSKAQKKRMRRLAVAWMKAHGTKYPRVRVDVIQVTLLPFGQSNLEHTRAVDA